MAKISKADAQKAAREVVKPIGKKITEVNDQIREFLTGIWMETIPVEVVKVWKKHPDYIKDMTSVYPSGVGCSGHRTESIHKSPSTSVYSKTLDLTPEQAERYLKMVDRRDELKEKQESTQREIEALIITLGTHKKVSEQLPEVMQFFPEGSIKENNQLMVQLAPVRKKVQCLVSADVEKKCIETI